MRIEFIRSKGDWPPRLFCATHSDRPTEPEHCSLISWRPDIATTIDCPAKVPFESFRHVSTQQPYKGGVTVWDIQDYARLRLLAGRPDAYTP
jgi:hypothetical protein